MSHYWPILINIQHNKVLKYDEGSQVKAAIVLGIHINLLSSDSS